MNYIKEYKKYRVAPFSIIDWSEELKLYNWSNKPIDLDRVKRMSEKFIGIGWFDKISKHVDDIISSFNRVDIDNVSDRLLEVWDKIPFMEKNVEFRFISGSFKNLDEKNGQIKYNVMYGGDKDSREHAILHIISDIIHPTIYIGYPSIHIRETDDQLYVNDDTWSCENFDINNFGIKSGDEIENGQKGRRSKTNIFSHDIKEKELYSVDKIIKMNRGAVVISVGEISGNLKNTIKLNELEGYLDEVIPSVLPEIKYDEVIWDCARGSRRFDDDMSIYDYTLKIVLK